MEVRACDCFGTYEEVAEHEETCPRRAHHAIGTTTVAGVASVGSSEAR